MNAIINHTKISLNKLKKNELIDLIINLQSQESDIEKPLKKEVKVILESDWNSKEKMATRIIQWGDILFRIKYKNKKSFLENPEFIVETFHFNRPQWALFLTNKDIKYTPILHNNKEELLSSDAAKFIVSTQKYLEKIIFNIH